MKRFITCLIILGFFATSIVNANPPANKGMGKGKANVTENFNSSDTPPGLQKRSTPYGLEKQSKTPYGWSKGKKTGWHKKHYRKHHGKGYGKGHSHMQRQHGH
ncbi:MAG: hypothetical protein HYX61_13395 [Gammaproteobacteria bacterium]|jgi:hypothetical protein|nr:hypothetical protein [Gammaproteobacteria bacterium]